MTALFDVIAAEIEARGPLDFARYMELALYHPIHGYYTSGAERAGWRGHFITSSEIDPAFGELWGRGVRAVWESCGTPEDFCLIEIGPGEGGLSAALIASAADDLRSALQLHLVEMSPSARRRQSARLPTGANWHGSLDEVPPAAVGCLIANEVFDNMPIRVAELRDGDWLECYVDLVDGSLVEVLDTPKDDAIQRFVDRYALDLLEGHRVEIPVAVEGHIGHIASIIECGAAIVIDYGIEVADLLAHPGGTLLAYSEAGVDNDVLGSPGERDVTAHVNWTAMTQAFQEEGFTTHGPVGQRDVLRALGTREVDARLREDYESAIASGRGLDAIALLSRRQALGALTDPGGLGGLQVVVATRGMAKPTWIKTPTLSDQREKDRP